jgi:DMSO/TMAO reductase YedYZ molybdopterin-dependent catalytic subunit
MRTPSVRFTNLSLLLALLVAFGTGAGAMAAGTASGRWVVIAHGVAAIMVILLVPWKSMVVRRGLRRRRPGRHASLLLAALLVVTLLAGLGHTTGVAHSVGGVLGMWVHVAAALTLVPFAVWHVVARRVLPRRADLSRRTVLRTTAIAAVAAGGYAVLGSAVALAGLPGARRRFTGSYETGSFRPEAMPTTIWLDDSVPAVDGRDYRLVAVDAAGRRELSIADLARFGSPVRATLDCTSGWYAEQDWSGVPVSALLRGVGDARSLLVHSVTGYWVRLPADDVDGMLLATAVGGAPLTPGHGYPVRLVAPGRRGFWWVKWVDRIELQTTPWWWQSPFPLT